VSLAGADVVAHARDQFVIAKLRWVCREKRLHGEVEINPGLPLVVEVFLRQFTVFRGQSHPGEDLSPLHRPALVVNHDPLGGGRGLQTDHDRLLWVVFQLDDSSEPPFRLDEEDTVGPLWVSSF